MNFSYEPLSQKQMEDIHQATLDILENCGVEMHSETVRNLFKKHGATIDGVVVKIPPNLVNNAVESCPSSFRLEAPNANRSVTVGHNEELLLCPSTTTPFIIDDEFQRRNATFEDSYKFYKLVQSSDCVNLGTQLMVFPTEGCTYREGILNTIYDYCTYTDKPFGLSGGSVESVTMADQMMNILTEKPDSYKMYVSLSPISPLRFEEDMLDGLLKTVELGQIVECVPMSVCGMTGPIKVIDNVVLTNAENLAMLTLVQLLNPGMAFLYSTYIAITDMRFLQISTGAPETFKMLSMARAMCSYYDIPFEMPSGGTDAKAFDTQAAIETTMGVMNAFAAKPDTATFIFGCLDSFNSINFRKFILDEEIVRNVKAYTKA
ncbi:MAG: trimethylamine methyltransferase family protein, partial [Eubacterium sp.]